MADRGAFLAEDGCGTYREMGARKRSKVSAKSEGLLGLLGGWEGRPACLGLPDTFPAGALKASTRRHTETVGSPSEGQTGGGGWCEGRCCHRLLKGSLFAGTVCLEDRRRLGRNLTGLGSHPRDLVSGKGLVWSRHLGHPIYTHCTFPNVLIHLSLFFREAGHSACKKSVPFSPVLST